MPNSAFRGLLSWKVSLKILNSGIILNIFTHALPCGPVDPASVFVLSAESPAAAAA